MGSIPSLRTNMVGWCNLVAHQPLRLGAHVQIVHGLHLFAIYRRLINRVEWVLRKVANSVENKQFTTNYVLTKWSVIFQWLRKISNHLNVEFDNGLQRFVERDSSESRNPSKLNLRGI